jgi:hypothetical protein
LPSDGQFGLDPLEAVPRQGQVGLGPLEDEVEVTPAPQDLLRRVLDGLRRARTLPGDGE